MSATVGPSLKARRILLSLIDETGGIVIAGDVADMYGMTRKYATTIVSELLVDGCIADSGRTVQGELGRPVKVYEVTAAGLRNCRAWGRHESPFPMVEETA